MTGPTGCRRWQRRSGRIFAESAVVDGELVALDKDGISSFPALQAALSAGRDETLVYYLFDLLYLDGMDLVAVLCRPKSSVEGAGHLAWHVALQRPP